ncbi:hypothetical protein Glove_26g182 [Diversispora epigaea]|uniref:Inhibitor I9 domain-containing protein n=1 Tax=Diversispora epigaea TaxID=1348612 RepID=A0A397JJ61_9GLOM|nr:hypothetical protein Glove_26g182 [Diversispora epigaea]
MAWIQKKPIFAILLFSIVLFTIARILFANEQITTGSARHRYIITLDKNTPKERMEEMEDTLVGLGAVIIHKYTIIMKGWAVEMSDSLVNPLSEDESVTSIEPDGEVNINSHK